MGKKFDDFNGCESRENGSRKLSNFPKSQKIGWKFLEVERRECE